MNFYQVTRVARPLFLSICILLLGSCKTDDESDISCDVQVYLDDSLNGSFTLLNNSAFTLIPTNELRLSAGSSSDIPIAPYLMKTAT